MEVTKADLSDLLELAESFSQVGIVDFVNIQANEITPTLPPPEENTCSNPPQDQPMRQSMDFHTDATPTFVGTTLKENPGRNLKRKLIDEWVAAIKIAATTLELDKENFIKLVELSLEGFVKIGWDNIPEDNKATILVGDSKGLSRYTSLEMDTLKEVDKKRLENMHRLSSALN
ncbi:UNVERIFIED_CONTAM: hypothetical protein Sindi_2664100 [Sesamum indicum]